MQLSQILVFLLGSCIFSFSSISHANHAATSDHQPKHFHKILVIIFENMSNDEIRNAPVFKKLIIPKKNDTLNGYAYITNYYNNQSGGNNPTRTSQPNYIALTSGSIQGVYDNDVHNLNVDNLAQELIDADIQWKIYAEDLPNPRTQHLISSSMNTEFNLRSGCFIGAAYIFGKGNAKDGYQRKHEPFISYLNIQNKYAYCQNIVNASRIEEDIDHMPAVAFYIPNQINDGHNGTLSQRLQNTNAFLAKMLGVSPKTGELLPQGKNALLQKFMAQDGLLVLIFDEPSISSPDKTMYTILAGRMINTGIFPKRSFGKPATCYPPIQQQILYPEDASGKYESTHCNHYNLLKMIEDNWNLRGLNKTHTSAGYRYAFPLDKSVPGLWKNND